MRRYWISSEFQDGNVFCIEGEVFHHIIDVCRNGIGSQFELIPESKTAFRVQINKLEKKRAFAEIISSRLLPDLKKPFLSIALSLCKFPVMDSIVEKAVELGVYSIQPFFSEQSYLRNETKFPLEKLLRWQKIVKSATQQSGRGELMTIQKPIKFDALTQVINPKGRNLCLFAYEGEGGQPMKTYLDQSRGPHFEQIWLIIGSEGGFSPSEVAYMKASQIQPITLGEQVLRVETACLTLVSILKYEFGLL